MKNRYLADIALATGIEHARGLAQAAQRQTPSFVSQATLNSTLEVTGLEGLVVHYIAPENLLKNTVFVAQGQECFLVRIPNKNGYSWFANRFYVVTHDAQRGYRCSATDDTRKAQVIEVVKRFIADEARHVADNAKVEAIAAAMRHRPTQPRQMEEW